MSNRFMYLIIAPVSNGNKIFCISNATERKKEKSLINFIFTEVQV